MTMSEGGAVAGKRGGAQVGRLSTRNATQTKALVDMVVHVHAKDRQAAHAGWASHGGVGRFIGDRVKMGQTVHKRPILSVNHDDSSTNRTRLGS